MSDVMRILVSWISFALVLGIGPEVSASPPFQELAERTLGPDQGVFAVAEDGTVLAAVAADRPVHPASVSKIPSTTALLQKLGANHRFETRLRGGPLVDGSLAGDLVVEATGDPFLLPQNAGSLVLDLRAAGLVRVEGGLRTEGPLFYDWGSDPSGERFRAALSGRVADSAWSELKEVRPDAPGTPVGLSFGREGPGEAAGSGLLATHYSPPLVRILKELNGYSNNVFHPLSDRIGGPEVVERLAREGAAPARPEEVRITNAAGLGTTNRLSPRAAVALVRALERELASQGLALTDVLPVAGVDRGTLEQRMTNPPLRGAVVAKTGTYESLGACALAGVVRTVKYGRVTFAILNRGVPALEARKRQDAFLAGLVEAAGARPFAYRARPSPVLREALLVAGGEARP
jgi:D-alanyl-D-alanine carboxypeptidase/D-alanyl-D-alanine-endopeptidase (penicillin-binding protein 4)